MSGWKLEHLRLTAFPVERIADGPAHWQAVDGGKPEVESLRKEGGLSTYIAEAPLRDSFKSLRVERDGGKVDWLLGAVQALSAPPLDPIAGEVEDYLVDLRTLIDSFSGRAALAARRLAVGCILLAPVETRERGYTELDSFLPAVSVDPASRDFLYRINRRRRSKQMEVDLNRVSEWSVARQHRLDVVADGPSAANDIRYFRRVRIDVNTSPDYDVVIEPAMQAAVLTELLGELLEIAERGDVP